MNEFLNNLVPIEHRESVASAILLALFLTFCALIYRGWKRLLKPFLKKKLNPKFLEWWADYYLYVVAVIIILFLTLPPLLL